MNKLAKIMLIMMSASVLTLGFAMAACSSNTTSPTQGTNTTAPAPTQGIQVGNLAPDFQFDNPEGRPVSLSDFRGRPVILNFWATWCSPCVYEMPYLQQVHEEWSSKGLVLLAINMRETPSRVEKFLQSHNLSLPVLLDTNADIARMYNVWSIPTTFFIDKDGVIQAARVGAFLNKEAIEDNLNKIMP